MVQITRKPREKMNNNFLMCFLFDISSNFVRNGILCLSLLKCNSEICIKETRVVTTKVVTNVIWKIDEMFFFPFFFFILFSFSRTNAFESIELGSTVRRFRRTVL